MESINTPNETTRLLHNSLLALAATALTAALWMLWWPLALGLAWGGFNALIDGGMSKWRRLFMATGMAIFVGCIGFFTGSVGVALVSFACYMVLVLKIK